MRDHPQNQYIYKNDAMKTILITILLGLTLQSTFAQKEKLFNGKDLTGWSIESDGQFSVKDGLLTVDRGTGWLRSDGEYADYTLVMKFKFLEPGANSGIFVRTGPESSTEEGGWPTEGYQVQCRDTLAGEYPLGHLIPYGAPPHQEQFFEDVLKRAYNPTGKWNTFKIICEGELMKVFLNGKLISTAQEIKKISGHIGIQGENGLLVFKKITVKSL